MTSSKSMFVLLSTLFCITGAVIYADKAPKRTPSPALGIAAYQIACAPKGTSNPACKSVTAIQATYKFDLMTEVAAVHGRMKKTARDVVQGRLTDAAYQNCVARGKCAAIPMLDEKNNLSPREAKKVSRQFWQLAEHEELTPEICTLIQLCDIGLRNGALAVSKNSIIPVPAKKP